MRSMNDPAGHGAHGIAAAHEVALAVGLAPDPRESFRNLLDNVNLIAVTIDHNARITYCNQFFLNLTGWSFKEIEGRNWHEVFVPPSIEDLRPLFSDMFRDLPDSWHHENDVLMRNGEHRTVRWNNMLFRDPQGNPVAAGSIGEDVTDRKKLERALTDCNARERGTLERELHDGLGQELVGIALLARSLATSASRDQLDIAEDLRRLSVIASNAIESCRKIARGFAPFSELQGGLMHAIRQLAVTGPNWQGPALEFSAHQTAPLLLSAEACDHVYHLAQEGVNNAVKHAGATRIQISLEIHPGTIGLTISDDGVGASKVSDLGAGLGVKMMRHRAALLHATLRFEPCGANGTRLLLNCSQPPLPP
jgi:PAS domain S-box-containing protein